MGFFFLIAATGVALWAAFSAAHAISAARLGQALRAEAPTSEDVAAVMSDARAEALVRWSQADAPQPIALARRPGELRRRTA
jgi:hypothetical protein